ncbi:MAG: hypothetical protein IKR57_02295 [Bacilli bacterium]|nr:hypothetical protein [Bacilli bacterium]
MNENNELLIHVYKSVSMGVESTTDLLKALKDRNNKIKGIISEELKEYEKFVKESGKLLKKNGIELEKPNLMVKISSNIGIMMETMKDNSDSRIATMLTEGFIMGINEMNNKIGVYKKHADGKIIKLCKRVMKFQENEINKLKTFI